MGTGVNLLLRMERRHAGQLPDQQAANDRGLCPQDRIQIREAHLIGSNGLRGRLGAISGIKCLLSKAMQDSFHGKPQSDLLVELTCKNSVLR